MTDEKLPEFIEIEGHRFSCPYIDLVPRHPAEKFKELEDSIADNGILVPVIVIDGDDHAVIDGYTRLMIAQKLGIKLANIPFVAIQCPREKAAVAAVLANAVRREWTREVRLQTVRKLFELKWPQRKIARAIGSYQSQVRYDLIHLGLIIPAPADEPTPAPEPPAPEIPVPPEPEPAPPGGQICPPPPPDNPKVEHSGPDVKDEPTPEPEESASDRRVRLLEKMMDLCKAMARTASDLEKFDLFGPSLQNILEAIDRIKKGKA